MTAETDYLVDRRRLKRKLSFWRVAAFLVALVAILGVGAAVAGRGAPGGLAGGNHIARVDISGFITGDQRTLDLLESVGKGRAKAVIVQIDSPGGTVAGSERLFNALRELSAKKPTVATVRGIAASGGYLAAMGAERIVAQETSLVGSIGVLFQYPNLTRLLDTVGVKMETVKSAPLKASPNPFEPTTPAAEAAVQALVGSSFDWFRRVVSERRTLEGQPLQQVTDGRVFTGKQALDMRLVDEIGGRSRQSPGSSARRASTRTCPCESGSARARPTSGCSALRRESARLWGSRGSPASCRRPRGAQNNRRLTGCWPSGTLNALNFVLKSIR